MAIVLEATEYVYMFCLERCIGNGDIVIQCIMILITIKDYNIILTASIHTFLSFMSGKRRSESRWRDFGGRPGVTYRS